MKFRIIGLIAAFTLVALARGAQPGEVPKLTPQEAASRVTAGTAVLIDVREPAEWENGVAEPARLLSLSDLRGEREKWKPVLQANREKELILYCRSGTRSGIAAKILSEEGYRVANAGGFADWQQAKLPVRKP